MADRRPNILFVLTDQLRADGLGCTGDWIRTPVVDRIAAEGVIFDNCFTNSPVCIPARLSLATGHYPHNTNVWQNCQHTLSPDAPTWMQAVRDAGYRTSLFGKTHLHPHSGDLRDREDLMRSYGLDDVDEIGGPRASQRLMSHMTARWQRLGVLEDYRADFDERFGNRPWVARPSALPPEEYADVYVARQARDYLEGYDRSQPWFCWLSFGGPHEPWDTPEPHASLYRPEDMPSPITPERPGSLPGHLHERLALESYHPPFAHGEIAAMRANYAGNVTLIDERIGSVVEVIKKRGEWENTVVLFSSDHGEMNGDWGLIYKQTFLDAAVKVPLILRIPGGATGVREETPVELMDIGPTLVELAGGSLEHRQFGQSLVGGAQRQNALSELRGEHMLVDQDWKAVINTVGQVYMLFDRKQDPEERHNLAGMPEVRQVEDRLRLAILQRIAASHIEGPDRS